MAIWMLRGLATALLAAQLGCGSSCPDRAVLASKDPSRPNCSVPADPAP